MKTRCANLTPAIRATLAWLVVVVVSAPGTALEPSPTDPTWSSWVEPLLSAQEATVLAGLEQQYERREFAKWFWSARDPVSETPRNELRLAWPQRRGTAETEFGGTESPRGRAFLLKGPPTFRLQELCPDQLKPLDIWIYPSANQEVDAAAVFFEAADGEMILWQHAQHELSDLLVPQAPSPRPVRRQLTRDCKRGGEVLTILEHTLGASDLYAVPDAGDWLDRFREEVLGTSRAELDCDVDFTFPGTTRNLTVVDGIVTVRRSTSDPVSDGGFILDGDVFRGELRADTFRYRFDSPEGDEQVERFSFRRHLAAGSYRVLLTLRSLDSSSIFHHRRRLQVPSPQRETEAAELVTLPGASTAVTIQPLPLGLLTGRQRVTATTSGDAVASMTFLLDGRRVMKKGRPPFSVELDLGKRPRTHTVEVVAQDAAGREVGRDLVPVNVGPHRFAVRLIEPRQGHAYREMLEIHANVNVPPGDKLDRVELFFNESRLATLYQPPFIHPRLLLPSRHATGYVRAVAVLDDGNSADDLVVINTGSTVDQLQVDFVELYISALDRKGSPLTGLRREEFSIFEDGQEQEIRRFESVSDLPINAAIVLDTSISMIEEIEEAQEAASRFFESVIQPKDRAAVVVFSDQPELRVPLTNSHSRLTAGLHDIEAAGETTLYDSVVFGLYYMVGLRGKKALILLTDGIDSKSAYDFGETLDFARFSGVSIYSIGIGIPRRDHEAHRVLGSLARETGGDSYFIDSPRELTRIYDQIENELRSQYLIGYQSSQTGSDDFRRVEIRPHTPGLEVKTAPGYYP